MWAEFFIIPLHTPPKRTADKIGEMSNNIPCFLDNNILQTLLKPF